MSEIYRTLANSANEEVSQIMSSGEQSIQHALYQAKAACEKEFSNIQTAFQKEDIVLTLSVPSLAAFEKIEVR